MSHISVNYDRTGFQEDRNVVFPIDRLRELAAEGIGSVAIPIISFMGATDPIQMEPYMRDGRPTEERSGRRRHPLPV